MVNFLISLHTQIQNGKKIKNLVEEQHSFLEGYIFKPIKNVGKQILTSVKNSFKKT
jgi:hypothetical protein